MVKVKIYVVLFVVLVCFPVLLVLWLFSPLKEMIMKPVEDVIGPSTFDAKCLIDGNDDDVLDILGMTGDPSKSQAPTIINGTNGEILWKGGNFVDEAKIHCISKDWFFIDKKNSQLNISQAKKPGTVMPFNIVGELRSYGLGENCIAFTNNNRNTTGIDLKTKKATECIPTTTKKHSQKASNIMTLTKKEALYQDETHTYKLFIKDNKDKSLWLSTTGNKWNWKRKLAYLKPKFGSAVAAGNNVIVVLGMKPEDSKTLYMVGINATTGLEKYAVPYKGSVSMLQYNGKYLIAEWGNIVHAFKINNGKRYWKVGR